MFGNTLRLIFAANHETGNVLQKQQRYAALTGQFYEMRSLQGAFTEQHTIVGQNSYGNSPNMAETAHERTAIERFEFVKPAVIDKPRSEEHTSELQSLMRTSYAVFCLNKKKDNT